MEEKQENQHQPKNKNWKQTGLAILFGIGIGGLILLINTRPKPEPILIHPTSTNAPISIYISGEVNNPGVYEVTSDQRVIDAINLAGGMTDEADLDNMNMASKMYDGQQIHIPNILEYIAAENQEESNAEKSEEITFPININYCSLEDLLALPGIGQTKAEAIIKYRDENGGFEVIEDLMKVNGIGESTFDNLKDKVTVK